MAEVDVQGRVAAVSIFEPDRRDEAIAELDERFLAGEGLAAAQPENLAVQLFDRSAEVIMDGRLEDALGLYRPDLVMDDHRRVVGMRFEGRDEFQPTASALFTWEFDRINRIVLGTHGDRVALFQVVFGNADSDIEALVLVELDGTSRFSRIDVFDPDDVEAAQALLRERAEP